MINTLTITLYKDVRLTSEYNEVIDPSYLDTYLNSKTKYEIVVEEMYLTFKGQLPIEKTETENINYFEYNYIKMVDAANSVTRYFFIDEINLINGVYLIDYTEDLWSSYISKIDIVRGNISNIRYIAPNHTPPLFLPDEFISNKKYTLNTILNSDQHGLNKDFYIVVEYSLYTPQTQGIPVTDRTLHCAVMADTETYEPDGFDFATCESYINYLIQYASIGGNAHTIPASAWYNIDITRAYIIPKLYFDQANVLYSSDKTQITSQSQGSAEHIVCTLRDVTTGIYSKSLTLNSKRKRFAIGTIETPVPVIYDSNSVDFEYRIYIDKNKFKLTLFLATNIIDISDSFEYEFPISAQTADVTQQQNIARTLRNNQLDINSKEIITTGAVSFASGLLKAGVGIAAGNYVDAAQSALSTTGSLLGLHYQMERNDLDKWALNYPSFSTSSSIKTNANLMLNCYYGIVEFEVDPDNDDYITNLIDTIGYKTMFIVTSKFYLVNNIGGTIQYNIIKFNNLWLKGSVSQNILQAIKAILLKGIKVYFTSAI